MTSLQIENVHLELLKKLLSDSGLECFRSPQESSESTVSASTEEQDAAEEEEEPAQEVLEEEIVPLQTEELVPESLPEIFPTPSLRFLLSEKARVNEKQNRIHVLPEEFKSEIDPLAIPKILTTPQKKYIKILADLVGCTRYKSSLAEYWFLDTLANLLRRAQEDQLDRPTQAILILWFCEWMKEMQHYDAADRTRMMRKFEDNMLAATRFIVAMEQLPTPEQAGVGYLPLEPHVVHRHEDQMPTAERVKPLALDSKDKVHFGPSFECCIRDLANIIHYIFDLFSTDYQFNLVRSVFTHTPEYSLIDGPYQLQNPKKLYTPLKVKTSKSPKKDKAAAKDAKGKGKKKEPDTAEYLAFLEKKAVSERILDEQAEFEEEQWNRKSKILPLTFAVDDEFFDKYWPPPTPPPPPPVETESAKGKKGKK